MKKLLLNLFGLTVVILFSCRKNSFTLPDPFPDNEITATTSVDGAAPVSCMAKGNATLFVKRTESNGTTLITIVGCSPQIEIFLYGIATPGTYFLDSAVVAGQYAGTTCDYIVGNPFAPTDMFRSSTYKNNSSISSGSVTVESISNSYVKGSFSATCMNNSGKIVGITNGNFKGNF
jgi:hypothetical protein